MRSALVVSGVALLALFLVGCTATGETTVAALAARIETVRADVAALRIDMGSDSVTAWIYAAGGSIVWPILWVGIIGARFVARRTRRRVSAAEPWHPK